MNKVIVDTCVWSLALRRARPEVTIHLLTFKQLLLAGKVQMLGPVRQELLSGVKTLAAFNKLEAILQVFDDAEILTEDYIQAARYYNICRSNGLQGSNTDFLLCAVSSRLKAPLLTTDKDFAGFKKYCEFDLLLKPEVK